MAPGVRGAAGQPVEAVDFPAPQSSPDSVPDLAADPCVGRPRRADAQRNHATLIEAARAAFTDHGADASLEGIAKRAGLGIGTLYRNFPNRRALLEAVYVDEVEALCRSAADLADLEPWDALVGWLDQFVGYVTTKKALVDEMMATMTIEDPVFKTCHAAIQDAGRPLLVRAQAAGVVRDDLEFIDVIRLVSGITMIKNSTPDDVRRVLAVALDGLRYRS